MAKQNAAERQKNILRDFALGYPESYEEFPWGELAIKVKKKIFVFLAADAESFRVTVKLPRSVKAALELPFSEPTGYGLGKSGWVTCTFGPDEKAPIDTLRQWIDESYRAVAPKKLVAGLDSTP